MLKINLSLCFFAVATSVSAQTIATCGPSIGFGNFHQGGIVKKKDSGFRKEEVSDGMLTFQKKGADAYDVLMVDSRKKIISLTQEGGSIILLRKGGIDATFMHYYQGGVIELYTLWIDADGKGRYDLIQSKGGDAAMIHKSSVLSGYCDNIRFDLL